MSFYVTPKNTYHLGLDHLEIFANFSDESIFDWVDFDNSNYGTIWEFTFTKNEVPKYFYKILFTKDDFPMFAFYKWKKHGKITTKNYVCLYSTFFKTHSIEKITEILFNYFKITPIHAIRRFDICLDILIPIEKVLQSFGTINQKWATFRGEWWTVETQYIWEKQKSLNKRQIIRIYNKKKDILSKGKNKLYQDYLLQDHVTRVELEVRRELAQNYTLEELVVPENLLGLLINYLEKHTSIFSKLRIEWITLYKKPKEVDFSLIQANTEWMKRVTTYMGHAKWLIKRWICPVYILLESGIVHEETKLLFDEIWWFNEIILEIRKQHRKWRKLLEKIFLGKRNVN
jgi:hypothetical protein